jgi:hypothetical protein
LSWAHLVKEVLNDDWSLAVSAFRLPVLVGANVGVLHHIRARLYRVASMRQDQPTRRALATLDVVPATEVNKSLVDATLLVVGGQPGSGAAGQRGSQT